MSTIDRRELLRRAGSASLAGLALTAGQVEAAHEHVAKAKAAAASGKAGPYAPKVFDAHEWATVRVLADMVLPADERSGSATDALVPEFIDAIATDELAEPREREDLQTRLRGGLRWLDRETRGRFGRSFVDCAEGERKAVLDAIAWPEHVAAGLEAGGGVLHALPRPRRLGLLVEQGGGRGPALRGQHVRRGVDRLPARGASRIGNGKVSGGGGGRR